MLHCSTNPRPDPAWSLSISAALVYVGADILVLQAHFLNISKFYLDWMELITISTLVLWRERENTFDCSFTNSHFTLLLAPAFSVYFSLSVRTIPFSPQPCFRLQYSLDVADRLADEHVLIGLYVNMLQNNPSRLVQAGHLGGEL